MAKELSKYDQSCVKHKQTNKQTKQRKVCGKKFLVQLLIALLVPGTHIHVYSVLQCTVKEKAFSNRPVSNYQNLYLLPRLRGNKREEAKHNPSIFKPFFYRVIIMLGLKNKQEFQ